MLPRQLRTCWLCWNVLSLWKQNTIEDFNGTKQITCNQAWLLVRHINHKEQDSWPWNEKITQLTKLWKPGLLSDVFEFMLINILLLSKTAREGLTAHSVSKTEWKHFYNLGASSMESSWTFASVLLYSFFETKMHLADLQLMSYPQLLQG